MAWQIAGVAGLLGVGIGGYYTHLSSLSCISPAVCTLGYPEFAGSSPESAWSVSEVKGVWSTPRPIVGPGLPGSPVDSPVDLSCTALGDCIAALVPGCCSNLHAAVALQSHGVWRQPMPIPGLAALGRGGQSQVSALSCGAAGWCVVAGSYWPPGKPAFAGHESQPFVASERDGNWRPARPLPGHAALNRGWYAGRRDRYAAITAISCDPAGTCAGGGTYRNPSGRLQPFVVGERNGIWGAAHTIAGVTATSAEAVIGAISCTSPGNCSAAGGYDDADGQAEGQDRVFVISEQDGRWGQSAGLPATVSVPTPADQSLTSWVSGLSCAAAGQCVITGFYAAYTYGEYSGVTAATPFIGTQVNGRWSTAREIPGLAALRRGGVAETTSVSCGTPGECAVGGYYTSRGVEHAFLVAQTDGVWGRAGNVRGLAALTSGYSTADFVYCGPSAGCVAVGSYHTRTGYSKAHLFVAARR